MAHDAGVELREVLVPAMDPRDLAAATTEAIRGGIVNTETTSFTGITMHETSPIPPAPNTDRISYGPRRVPAARAMRGRF